MAQLDEEKVKLQACTLCNKMIRVQNLFLHGLHCSKVHAICDRCDMLLLKENMHRHIHCDEDKSCDKIFTTQEEMKTHILNDHTRVSCTACSLSVSPLVLKHHMSYECAEREVQCSWCSKDVVLSMMEEHEKKCGHYKVIVGSEVRGTTLQSQL